jgi:hypothetical protein
MHVLRTDVARYPTQPPFFPTVAQPPQERSAATATAPNAIGNSVERSAHKPVVGLLDPLTT